MKKLLLLLSFISVNSLFAQVEIIPTFVEKWENSKVYLLEVAKAMPEDKYDYKPTDREMVFRDQLFHIMENMNWLSTTYFSNQKYVKKEYSKTLSKEALLIEISNCFDTAKELIQKSKESNLIAKVDFFAGKKTKFQILNLMQDHVTHHRGQILVYLNLNQIQPPKYIGW